MSYNSKLLIQIRDQGGTGAVAMYEIRTTLKPHVKNVEASPRTRLGLAHRQGLNLIQGSHKALRHGQGQRLEWTTE